MKKLLAILALAVMLAGFGCAALSEYVTPAIVDQKAVKYAASAGVVDANEFRGYANLEKAIRLETAVENAYQVKSLALAQMAEKNQLDYGVLRGVVTGNTQIARQREEQLFGPTGLLSTGLTALGAGGLAGLLGLMRKRPGDITKEEYEQAMNQAGREISTTERQLLEVVKGVQRILDAHPKTDPIGAEIRQALNSTQSADTRQAIASAKAVLA